MFFNKPRYNLARNQKNVQQSIDIAMRSNMSIQVNNSLIESMLATNTLGMTPEDAKLESERLRGLNAVNQTINEASRLNLLHGRKIDDNNNRMIAEPTVQDSISKLADQLTNKKDKKIILPQNLSRFQRYVDIGYDQKLRKYRNPAQLVMIDMNKDEFISVSKAALIGKGISESKLEDMLDAIVWNNRYIIISFEHSFGSKFGELNNKLTLVKSTEDRYGELIDGANKADIGVGQQVALPKGTGLADTINRLNKSLTDMINDKKLSDDDKKRKMKKMVNNIGDAVDDVKFSGEDEDGNKLDDIIVDSSDELVDQMNDDIDQKPVIQGKEDVMARVGKMVTNIEKNASPEDSIIFNDKMMKLLGEAESEIEKKQEIIDIGGKIDFGKRSNDQVVKINNDFKQGKTKFIKVFRDGLLELYSDRAKSWNVTKKNALFPLSDVMQKGNMQQVLASKPMDGLRRMIIANKTISSKRAHVLNVMNNDYTPPESNRSMVTYTNKVGWAIAALSILLKDKFTWAESVEGKKESELRVQLIQEEQQEEAEEKAAKKKKKAEEKAAKKKKKVVLIPFRGGVKERNVAIAIVEQEIDEDERRITEEIAELANIVVIKKKNKKIIKQEEAKMEVIRLKLQKGKRKPTKEEFKKMLEIEERINDAKALPITSGDEYLKGLKANVAKLKKELKQIKK